MTLIAGLTGGIACGKSAVSSRLRERGAIIVDADQIARDILAPGSIGLKAIVERWGAEVLTPEEELDRTKLGAIIFNQPQERAALELITHPLIAQESADRLRAASRLAPPLVVYDAALLIEAGRAEQFRPLIVVTTTLALQRSRLMARDGLNEEEAQARLDSQLPLSQKAEFADYLIQNDGDWRALDQQVEALWSSLQSSV